MMGRKEVLQKILERKTLNQSETSPLVTTEQTTPIVIVSIKNISERYGYSTSKREELKKRADVILQKPPSEIVNDAISLYGTMMVASIASEGSVNHLNNWLNEPIKHTLAGDTKTSLRRLATGLDFANQLRDTGKNNDEIKHIFIQRQPELQGLSLGTAIGRVGKQDIGLLHEAADTIANGGEISPKIKEKMGDYVIPDTERGH